MSKSTSTKEQIILIPVVPSLTWEGRMKMAERIIRYGGYFSPDGRAFYSFVYDRTLAWNRGEAGITETQFLEGHMNRSGELVAAFPIGFNKERLERARSEVVDSGAVGMAGMGTTRYYWINTDWEPDSVMKMWTINERDYIYPEEFLKSQSHRPRPDRLGKK